MANCSVTSSPSGLAANWLITNARDELMYGLEVNYSVKNKDGNCTACLKHTFTIIASGFIKLGTGLYLAVFLVASAVEFLARFLFAFLTLPMIHCKEGRRFYENVSIEGMVNSVNSMRDISKAFFENFYKNIVNKMVLRSVITIVTR